MWTAAAAMATALLITATGPALAGTAGKNPERFDSVVASAGAFHTCDDGRVITFESLSHRAYTRWYDEAGVLVRERRHLSFDGTLSSGDVTLPYTGVWNRDENFVTGALRITGGNFRVPLPSGRVLVGAGLREEGNAFVGSGERWLIDLCAAFDELD